MQRSMAFLVLFFFLLGCAPTAAASTPTAAANPTAAPTSTPAPAADPTQAGTSGCADRQEVMGYLSHMGYSDFQEAEPVNDLSVVTFSDQDAQEYGQSIMIRSRGDCVLDIRGVFASHYPATDDERTQFSLFMTAVSLAGLTVDQRQVLVDWIADPATSGVLLEAVDKGTAARSTTLSSLSPFPAVELRDEVTDDMIFTHYHVVFGDLPAE